MIEEKTLNTVLINIIYFQSARAASQMKTATCFDEINNEKFSEHLYAFRYFKFLLVS